MSPPALHQIFNSVDASNVVALCMAMRHSILTQTRGGSSGGGGGGVLDFIALDCEFSGLGDGKGSRLNTRDG